MEALPDAEAALERAIQARDVDAMTRCIDKIESLEVGGTDEAGGGGRGLARAAGAVLRRSLSEGSLLDTIKVEQPLTSGGADAAFMTDGLQFGMGTNIFSLYGFVRVGGRGWGVGGRGWGLGC
jgi:hypothetical protein